MVSSSGLAPAVGVGSATVTATTEGQSGSAAVAVVDNVIESGESIQAAVNADMGRRASSGQSRRTLETPSVFTRNIRFVTNTYMLGINAKPFHWQNVAYTKEEWRGFGHDVTGTFQRETCRTGRASS